MQAQGMSMVFNDIESLHKVLQANEGKVLSNKTLAEYELRARPFNSSVLENNHVLFNCFQRMCEDRSYLAECLPALEKMGFETSKVL
jgi:2-polyprenyl-6-methoxyphenol hydroxylase-like FAD-dependent oxidoreductase